MSWMPPESSSVKVRIGRRRFESIWSPTAGITLRRCERVCSIDMNSVNSARLKAQVSTTCWPCVLMTLTRCPALTKAALPLRAGMVIWGIVPPSLLLSSILAIALSKESGRILGLVIAELLWRRFPNEAEGALTRRHTQLVRRETLAKIARSVELAPHIIMSVGEDAARTRESAGILADVCEAVIAALYLDGGLDAAARFIERNWAPLIKADATPPRDPKTALQEWAQGRGRGLPRYETVQIEGPAHKRRFTVRASVEGLEPESAAGSSKRAAEIAAAAALLARIAGGESGRGS